MRNDEAARQGRPDTNLVPAETIAAATAALDRIEVRSRVGAAIVELEGGETSIAYGVLVELLWDIDALYHLLAEAA